MDQNVNLLHFQKIWAEQGGRVEGADTLEGWAAVHKDPSKSEEWASRKPTEFNRGKCELLHLGQSNPTHPYRGLGDDKLHLGYRCTLAAVKATHLLGCIRQGTAKVKGSGCSPPEQPSALVRPLVITLAKESDRPQVIYFSHINTNTILLFYIYCLLMFFPRNQSDLTTSS